MRSSASRPLLRRGAQSANNIDRRRSLVTRDLWGRVQPPTLGVNRTAHPRMAAVNPNMGEQTSNGEDVERR
jgi:hypothetical protein